MAAEEQTIDVSSLVVVKEKKGVEEEEGEEEEEEEEEEKKRRRRRRRGRGRGRGKRGQKGPRRGGGSEEGVEGRGIPLPPLATSFRIIKTKRIKLCN